METFLLDSGPLKIQLIMPFMIILIRLFNYFAYFAMVKLTVASMTLFEPPISLSSVEKYEWGEKGVEGYKILPQGI